MEVNTIQIKKAIKDNLSTPMPEYLHKQKGKGKNATTYVGGHTIIDKLNATFGYAGWSWEIVDKWIQTSEDKITKTEYVNGQSIKLPEDRWSIEAQGPVAHIIGRLTVYFERPDGSLHTVSKMAPGSQPLVGGQSEQENCFKGAHTDAIKKAATMFGIALELYRDENEQYFFEELSYENPWTDEAKAEHEDSLNYIKAFKEEYGFSSEDLGAYVAEFSDGEYDSVDYIVPDNIEAFVEYLVGKMSTNSEEE